MLFTLLPKRLVLFATLCLTLLSSCFDLVDEITMNADGTGEFVLTLNLSKSKTKIASLMLLDSVNGHKVPSKDDILLAIKNTEDFLKNENGISNVSHKADFANYIFSVRCNFTSIDAMNRLAEELIKQNNLPQITSKFAYQSGSKTFERKFDHGKLAKTNYAALKEADKKVFDEASYTSIYRFDQEIGSFSNTHANLSKSKKAILLRLSALEFINGTKSLSNKIQLK
ncbi:MAG: hypothetical protein ACFCUL_12285 [Flavobacteriaceae bacterium]